MRSEDVKSFLLRDWGAVAEEKAQFWVSRKRELGAAEGLRVSDELRRQVIAIRPDWPDEAERRSDLEAHTALSKLMKHAGASIGR